MLIEDMVPELSVEMRMCPDFTIERALVNAASRYCMDTESLREIVTAQGDGSISYYFGIPSGYQMYHVVSVFAGEKELFEATGRRLHALSSNTAPTAYTASPDYDSVLIELDAPTTEALRAEVALRPTPDCTEFPDLWIAANYRPIQFMALSDLAAIPNKPWSNPSMVSYYREKYEDEVRVMKRTPSRRRTMRFSW